MVEITYQMVLSTIQTVSLIVGIIYYLNIMRNAQKIRERENLYLRFQILGKEYQMAVRDFMAQDWGNTMEDFRTHSLESRVNFDYLQMTYNTIGLMLKEKIIDPDMLYQMHGPQRIMLIWERIENIVQDFRVNINYPRFLESFEYLYNETKKRFPDIIIRRTAQQKF
jgi:hypothetical protein